MKKILLTLAAGVFILALPVIASAATTYDNYSGFTASMTIHGFKLYSTTAGMTAGMKQFTQTENADKTLTGPKNTVGYFITTANINFPGAWNDYVRVWINAHTVLYIDPLGSNIIGAASGKTVYANGWYYLFYTDGDATIVNTTGDLSTPASAGLTGTYYQAEGSCTLTAKINPKTHNIILYVAIDSTKDDNSWPETSVSNGSGGFQWQQGNDQYNWITTGIGTSAIKLTPTSGLGYDNAWWK